MQTPAYLNRKTIALADDLTAGLTGQRAPTLSIKGNTFTLVDAAGNEKPAAQFDPATQKLYVDIIVVDGNRNLSKIYYESAYVESEEFRPPTCWSDNGVGPSTQAMAPQAPTCAACQWNRWGSAISANGKEVQACRSAKKIAVMVRGHGDMVFLLRIPPNSLTQQWAAYVRTIAGNTIGGRKADVSDVVTRVTFVSQGTLGFAAVDYITEEEMEAVIDIQTNNKAARLVGKDDAPVQGALPPPPPQPAPAQQFMPAPQPAPAQQFMPAPQPAPAQQFMPAPQPAPAQQFMPTPQAAPAQQFMPTPQSHPQPGVTGRVRRTRAQIEADRAAQRGAALGVTPGPAPVSPPAPIQTGGVSGASQQAPQPAPAHGLVQNAPPPPSDMRAALMAALDLPTGG